MDGPLGRPPYLPPLYHLLPLYCLPPAVPPATPPVGSASTKLKLTQINAGICPFLGNSKDAHDQHKMRRGISWQIVRCPSFTFYEYYPASPASRKHVSTRRPRLRPSAIFFTHSAPYPFLPTGLAWPFFSFALSLSFDG